MFFCDLISALTVFSKFLGSFPNCSNSLLEKNIDSFSVKCVKWENPVMKYKKTSLSWDLIWGQNLKTCTWIVIPHFPTRYTHKLYIYRPENIFNKIYHV